MFINFLLTALRVIRRHRVFTAINIAGLATGISASLVIFLIVHYENGFDRYEKDQDLIYRVVIDARFNGIDGHSAGVQAPLSAAIPATVPGIRSVVPVMGFQGEGTVDVEVNRGRLPPMLFRRQAGVVFSNPAYVDIFSLKFIAGNSRNALSAPFSVVLNRERAALYFPGVAAANVIGKKLLYKHDLPVTVTGVVEKETRQTDFTASEIISISSIATATMRRDFMMEEWNDWMSNSTLLLQLYPGSELQAVKRNLNALLVKNSSSAVKNSENYVHLNLQPLADIHFNPLYQSPGFRTASKSTLRGLLAVAVFLLLLGVINFINLTTAQAANRAKETGIRKTMGSTRLQLIFRFMGETGLISLLAGLLALVLLPFFFKVFHSFIPPGLLTTPFPFWAVLIFLMSTVVLVGVAAGIYPAFVQSRYLPSVVLKSQAAWLPGRSRSAVVRKVLTVLQFGIAQFFLIATLLVSKQIRYSMLADIGFNYEAVVTLDLPHGSRQGHRAALMQDIRALPGVAQLSSGFLAPADQGMSFTNIAYFNGQKDIFPDINVQIRWGDPNYLRLYQIPLVAGRNVLPSDSIREFVINETYAHAIGFARAADAVGAQLSWNNKHMPVVGVMKDFHDQSMRARLGAVILGGTNGNTLHIKLQGKAGRNTWPATLAAIAAKYKTYYPDDEFNPRFVDNMIAGFYRNERETAGLLGWSTAMAIFISCLGLLGLVVFTTQTRTKEIGVRKVLGASVTAIVVLLSKDMLKLVAIAFLLAAPVSGWVMYKWLQDYAFKTPMSWWVFAISGTGMLMLALSTLAFQVTRSARANPANSLRTE